MKININNIKHKLENKFKSKPELIYVLEDNITKNIEKEFIEFFNSAHIIFYKEKLQEFFFYQYNYWELKNNYESYDIVKVFDDVYVKNIWIVDNALNIHIKVNDFNLYTRKDLCFYEKFIDLIINTIFIYFQKN